MIELSPFVVGAATDRGYQALNALSGTRLNTKLEDLGSSITVVTKQQMEDTAVLDLNDVFLYEANTEGTGNFTDFSTNRNGGVVDNIQNSPAQANRIRGVGRANIAVGGFAVNPRIPLDTYNVDGVEISRGPNSNIFGLGGSAGTVNYIAIRANATRSISQATFRADSYGGVRGTFDFNRPLLDQKLALRVAAVEEAKGFVRKPSSEKISRLQGLVLFKPFANTTLRVSAENYDNFARRTNSLTPRETVTGWAAAGKESPTAAVRELVDEFHVGADQREVVAKTHLDVGAEVQPVHQRGCLEMSAKIELIGIHRQTRAQAAVLGGRRHGQNEQRHEKN